MEMEETEELLAVLREERAGQEHLFKRPRLARFLGGNNGNVQEAAEHFRRMLKWRKDNNIEAVRQRVTGKAWRIESVPGLQELYKMMWLHSFSWAPDGNLIWVQRDGRADVAEIMAKFDEVRATTTFAMELRQEHLDARSEEQGRLIKVLQVRDLSGLSIASVVRDALLMRRLAEMLKFVNMAYPENVHKLIIINTPTGFGLLWAALQPMINDRIRSKFIFVPGGPFDFPEELVNVAGSASLEALERARHGGSEEGSTERQIPAGTAEYASYRLQAQETGYWSFKVPPKASSLECCVLFVGDLPDGRAAAPVVAFAQQPVTGTVQGEFRAAQGPGLLWLTWHNRSNWSEVTVSELRMSAGRETAESYKLNAPQQVMKKRGSSCDFGCWPSWPWTEQMEEVERAESRRPKAVPAAVVPRHLSKPESQTDSRTQSFAYGALTAALLVALIRFLMQYFS